jgi:predicted phosphodiesterase
MKIQYMSDIHLEFGDMPVPEVLGDVLVLAGDIHVGVNAIPWIEQCAQKFDHVIYLLGNHEYYGQKFWKLPGNIQSGLEGNSAYVNGSEEKRLKIFDEIKNVYLLDNASVKIEDVYFHGSTLWSNVNPMCEYHINDFRKITFKYPEGYGKFSANECKAKHFQAKWWLHDNIMPGEKNVVLTHFAPSFQMINQARYKDDMLNSYYATEILGEFYEDHGEDIKVWVSGHTHSAYDKVIDGIHSVSNCRGYVGYESVDNFNPIAMVEV